MPQGQPDAALGRARPTSRDVAQDAGVSQATVSLVLSGKGEGRISARTSEAVRRSAARLGYRPNLAARTLRAGRTRTGMLVVPALNSDFFARVHFGAVREAARHDFGLLLYPTHSTPPAPGAIEPDTGGRFQDPLGSAGAALDGVIASSLTPGTLPALRSGTPVVMLDDDPALAGAAATVNLDIADGMRQAAEHLLALGHRRIGHVAAAIDSWTFRVRARALGRTLADGGAAQPPTASAPLNVPGGLRAATELLMSDPRPTALVCDDGFLAAGASKAACRLGLRVPQDVSLTGVDGVTLATALEPELTTVDLPAEEFGAAGMRALLDVVDGRAPRRGVLPVSLAVRGSTGPAPD